jgi:aldehyde:ferredoxin oxidoreductase
MSYMGAILRVNLTNGTLKTENFPRELARLYLGGRGLATKMYVDETDPKIDPLAPEYAALLNAALGENWTPEDIVKIGERIWNTEKKYNLAAGMDPASDTLPERFLKEPAPSGPNKGHVHQLGKLLPKYYAARGWDEKGIPGKEKLASLSI